MGDVRERVRVTKRTGGCGVCRSWGMERTNACFMFCSKGPREQIGCLASVCSCFLFLFLVTGTGPRGTHQRLFSILHTSHVCPTWSAFRLVRGLENPEDGGL